MHDEPQVFTHGDMDGPHVIGLPCADIAVFSACAPGKDTPNEDSAIVLPCDSDGVIIAIADGAGGYAGGDLASRIAVEALAEAFAAPGELPVRAVILNAFELAHARIIDQTDSAATTFAVVELSSKAIRTYHAGDSGVLLTGGRGRIRLQTVSHSPTGYGVESGLLDEDDALHHDERHIVSNLLGLEPMSVEIGSPLDLAARDTVVLASDGLFDNVYPDEICEAVRKGPVGDACQTLIDIVRNRMAATVEGEPSKPDDLTVVLMRLPR